MAKFVVQFVYGPDRDSVLAARPAHREYLQRLADEGRLLAAGPYEDGLGGMLVYDAADADEAQQMVNADPYTKAGVLADSTIREWKPLYGTWTA